MGEGLVIHAVASAVESDVLKGWAPELTRSRISYSNIAFFFRVLALFLFRSLLAALSRCVQSLSTYLSLSLCLSPSCFLLPIGVHHFLSNFLTLPLTACFLPQNLSFVRK